MLIFVNRSEFERHIDAALNRVNIFLSGPEAEIVAGQLAKLKSEAFYAAIITQSNPQILVTADEIRLVTELIPVEGFRVKS